MVAPLGDRPNSTSHNPVHQLVLSQFQGELAERLDVEQMFILIDGVLPFEACLYYQVLPLYLDGSRLTLGMVTLEDLSAIDYVRRIISYHNYSLVPRTISSGALQAVLSAYLNYTGSQQNNRTQRHANSSSHRVHRNSARARSEQKVDRANQPTLVVDSPEELIREELEHHHPATPERSSEDVKPLVASASQPAIEFLPSEVAPPEVGLDATQVDGVEKSAPSTSSHSTPSHDEKPPEVPPLLYPLPPLEVEAKYLSSPAEVLATLSPAELLRELMGRVLFGGIGRLYFERQPTYGRILWSQNGVLQSVLDRIDPALFQGVMDELKQMTHLPLIPVEKPIQVESERLYQHNRILLRFRFMLSPNGEEATLQVLRGAALKFYQQQQIVNLERDALSIAKQLQIKVNEIRDRARIESNFSGAKLDALPTLTQMLHRIEEELGSIQSTLEDSANLEDE